MSLYGMDSFFAYMRQKKAEPKTVLTPITEAARAQLLTPQEPVPVPRQIPRRAPMQVEKPVGLLQTPAIRVENIETFQEQEPTRDPFARPEGVFPTEPPVRRTKIRTSPIAGLDPDSYDRLRTFLHQAEGGQAIQEQLGFFKGDRFMPYGSAEGGNPTIGYGHKLTDSEVKSGRFDEGITTEEAEKLFVKDVRKAKNRARDYFKGRFGKQAWNELDPHRRAMAIEFAFNIGNLALFPKFTKALHESDWKTVAREYKRYFRPGGKGKKELKRRNELFYETFIAPKLENENG